MVYYKVILRLYNLSIYVMVDFKKQRLIFIFGNCNYKIRYNIQLIQDVVIKVFYIEILFYNFYLK